jgi:tetratricopeptide (TPR) repeat protein
MMPSGKLLKTLPLLLIPSVLMVSCSRDPKARAQRYVDNGNKFFAKEKYKEAGIMYRKALQQDLRFGEAYYRLGLTDLKLNAYAAAANNLRRAVSLQPANDDAAIRLSDLYLMAATQDAVHRVQFLTDTKELIDKLLQRAPQSFDGHRLKGHMALIAGKPEEAVKEFEQANAINPFQPGLIVAYFQALVFNHQYPESEKLARDMIVKDKTFSPMYDLLYVQYMRQNKIAEAEEVLKLKIENNPGHSRQLVQLAQHYFLLRRHDDMNAVIARLGDEKKYPDGHLSAGDFLFFRAREFGAADTQYQAGVKAFPKEKTVYQKRIIELYATTGRNQEANSLLATMLKESPKDVDAIAMRAALMLSTGNRDQINLAANDLQSLVTKSPTNHLYRFNLARAMVAKGELDPARLQLEEAIKIRPDFLSARELLARIYLAKGDSGRALKAADEVIAMDRGNLQGHLIRSSALLSMSDKDKAHQELDYLTKAYPQSAEARYQVGFMAYQEQDFKKAEQVFSELYKAYPNNGRALAGLTETLASEHRLPEAIGIVKTALTREPERRELNLFLANLDLRSEHYDDAIAIYKAVLVREPRSAQVLFMLGEAQGFKGDTNAAIESFRHCSQEAPNDTNCLLALSLAFEGTGKRDQAKPIYEQILKIQPDHPVALNNLAFIKAEEGVDLDQALTMAQRAVQKVPGSHDMADTLGWVYIKKNLSEDAIRVFRDLIQKEPNKAQFHYHYGMALLQKGDKPSAKREFETALKDKPSKDEEAKIHELLQKI